MSVQFICVRAVKSDHNIVFSHLKKTFSIYSHSFVQMVVIFNKVKFALQNCTLFICEYYCAVCAPLGYWASARGTQRNEPYALLLLLLLNAARFIRIFMRIWNFASRTGEF